jgi:hypothetical protein
MWCIPVGMAAVLNRHASRDGSDREARDRQGTCTHRLADAGYATNFINKINRRWGAGSSQRLPRNRLTHPLGLNLWRWMGNHHA